MCCKLSIRLCTLSLNLVLLLPSTPTVRKDSARLVFSAPPPQDLSAGREVRATMLSFQAEISVPSILFGFCFFFPSEACNLGRVPCPHVWFFSSSLKMNVILFPPLEHSGSGNFSEVVTWTLPLFTRYC